MHLYGSYDIKLVILSFVVVVFASYTAIDLTGRIIKSKDRGKIAWLVGGALSMGLGIWSMHFIGMLAYKAPMTIQYDPGLLILSVCIAVAASFVSLYVLSRPSMSKKKLLMGAVIISLGILVMHFIGMAAMRMEAMIDYNIPLVVSAAVIALITSTLALRVACYYKNHHPDSMGGKLLSASIMGLAVAVPHYTAMAAVEYHTHGSAGPAESGLSHGTMLLVAGISLAVVFIQILVSISIAIDKKLSEQNQLLLLGQQQYESLVNYNPDIIFRLDNRGKVETVNSAVLHILGYTEAEMKLISFDSLLSRDEWKESLHYYWDTLKGSHRSFEVTVLHKNRSRVNLQITTVPVYVDNEVEGVYGIAKDVTKQKKYLEKINYMAYHDELTGLPNRRGLKKQTVPYLKGENPLKAAVFLIDINRFKSINDILGHTYGDLLLVEISNRFRSLLKEGDILGKIGDNDFALFRPNLKCLEEAEVTAKELVRVLREPIKTHNHEIYATASVGISTYPQDGDTWDELLKRADLAMLLAKGTGKTTYKFFAESMESRLDKIKIEEEMRAALYKNDEFLLHYQPKIDTKAERISGVEALVRWKHPRLGFVSPAEFIPIAEETGLIVELGEKILSMACAQLHDWHMKGYTELHMAVNISTRQFMQENFVEKVEQLLHTWKIDGRCLELEITESTAMNNVNRAIFLIERLRSLGVRIALDDFGTGYSSFAYLKDYPINTLKIDQSFIRNLATGGPDEAIIASIVTLAKNIQLDIVAEGVETKAQYDFLKDLECSQVQGYLFSKPLLPEELEEKFLKSSERLSSLN